LDSGTLAVLSLLSLLTGVLRVRAKRALSAGA
jgi:hypothetical protein